MLFFLKHMKSRGRMADDLSREGGTHRIMRYYGVNDDKWVKDNGQFRRTVMEHQIIT